MFAALSQAEAPISVMAGLVPAVHALLLRNFKEDVDARHKAGHDDVG
jgi:hypothetical protein